MIHRFVITVFLLLGGVGTNRRLRSQGKGAVDEMRAMNDKMEQGLKDPEKAVIMEEIVKWVKLIGTAQDTALAALAKACEDWFEYQEYVIHALVNSKVFDAIDTWDHWDTLIAITEVMNRAMYPINYHALVDQLAKKWFNSICEYRRPYVLNEKINNAERIMAEDFITRDLNYLNIVRSLTETFIADKYPQFNHPHDHGFLLRLFTAMTDGIMPWSERLAKLEQIYDELPFAG